MKYIFTILSFVYGLAIFAGDKDTVYAFVSSNSEKIILDDEQLESTNIANTIDSLQNTPIPPSSLIKELKWFQNQHLNSKEQIVFLIDSLMSLDSIPYNLVNYINLHINRYKKQYEAVDFYEKRVAKFYNEWDTENPWNFKVNYLDSLDDTFLLSEIGNDAFDFHFPIQKKSKEKYYYHGTITSRYGWRNGAKHNGVDLDLHVWDSVYTCYSGTIRLAKVSGGYGRVVIVRHDNGLETLYGHLHRFKVKSGDKVVAGQVIGLGGSSGKSTGSHLHFEVRFKGIPINPEHLVDFKKREGRGSDYVLKKSRNGLVAIEKGSSTHKVQRGDSPWKISNRYGMTLTSFRELNGFTKSTRLSVGQIVKIKI